MFDWYRKTKHDQVILLESKGNVFKKVGREFLDDDQEVIELEDKQINVPKIPQFINKHGKLIYFVDRSENEAISFSQVESAGLTSDEQDTILGQGMLESFVKAQSELGITSEIKIMLLLGLGTGTAIGMGLMIALRMVGGA